MFAFASAPTALRRIVLDHTLGHYEPLLAEHYGVIDFDQSISVQHFAQPVPPPTTSSGSPSLIVGWSTRLQNAVVSAWSLGMDTSPTFSSFTRAVTRIVGLSPMERLNMEAFLPAFHSSLALSSVAAVRRYVDTLAVTQGYIAARFDENEVKRYNAHALNRVLADSAVDTDVIAGLETARLAGLRAALEYRAKIIPGKLNSQITLDQFAQAQSDWLLHSGHAAVHVTLGHEVVTERALLIQRNTALVRPEAAESVRDHFAFLDVIRSTHEVMSGFSDQQIDAQVDGNGLLVHHPEYVGLTKQASKMCKSYAGFHKVFLLANLADSRPLVGGVDIFWIVVGLRNVEDQGGLLKATRLDTTIAFREIVEAEQPALHAYAGRLKWLDQFGRIVSTFTGMLAMYQIYEAGGLDASTSGLGNARDVAVGALDFSRFATDMGAFFATTVLDDAALALSAKNVATMLGHAAVLATFLSSAVSTVKYFNEAVTAAQNHQWLPFLSRSVGGILSLGSTGYAVAAMVGYSALGPAAVLGVAATFIVTAEMFFSAWWANYKANYSLHSTATAEALIFDTTVGIRSPVVGHVEPSASVLLSLGLEVGNVVVVERPSPAEVDLHDSVEVGVPIPVSIDPVVGTSEPSYTFIAECRAMFQGVPDPMVFTWDTGFFSQTPGIHGITGYGFPQPVEAGSSAYPTWIVASPIPGSLTVAPVIEQPTTRSTVLFSVRPELETWCTPTNGGDFSALLVAEGDVVHAEQPLARTGDETTGTYYRAKRPGVVTGISAAVDYTGTGTATAIIRVGAVLN